MCSPHNNNNNNDNNDNPHQNKVISVEFNSAGGRVIPCPDGKQIWKETLLDFSSPEKHLHLFDKRTTYKTKVIKAADNRIPSLSATGRSSLFATVLFHGVMRAVTTRLHKI